jgi:hypothetical protein
LPLQCYDLGRASTPIVIHDNIGKATYRRFPVRSPAGMLGTSVASELPWRLTFASSDHFWQSALSAPAVACGLSGSSWRLETGFRSPTATKPFGSAAAGSTFPPCPFATSLSFPRVRSVWPSAPFRFRWGGSSAHTRYSVPAKRFPPFVKPPLPVRV